MTNFWNGIVQVQSVKKKFCSTCLNNNIRFEQYVNVNVAPAGIINNQRNELKYCISLISELLLLLFKK